MKIKRVYVSRSTILTMLSRKENRRRKEEGEDTQGFEKAGALLDHMIEKVQIKLPIYMIHKPCHVKTLSKSLEKE